MSSILFTLPELFKNYNKWVCSHPQLASDFETTAKWLSYFIAGRINNSTVVSELMFTLSNLLVLFNDRIISKAHNLEIPGSGDKLKLWLTILEYSQVFLELSAKKIWGETGKWLIVVAVQTFKCISRLLLVFQHNEKIIESPPITVLKRKELAENQNEFSENLQNESKMSFVLKRSGKIIRKVDTSPPVNVRNWKPLTISNNNNNNEKTNNQIVEKDLIGRQLYAETIYILKPVAHLSSTYIFGENTWKPWLLSLFMDLTSLHLYQTCENYKQKTLSKRQHIQLTRRYLSFLFYLLRSPFYEKYSKDRIRTYLLNCSKLPLVGLICSPLAQYIPHWQKIYFYMWSI